MEAVVLWCCRDHMVVPICRCSEAAFEMWCLMSGW